MGGGAHTITATYHSDMYFAASSGSNTHNVIASSATTIDSSPDPTSFGSMATFTANVSAVNPSAGTPTGDVTFKEGATVLATVSVDGSGQAVFQTTDLPVGTHTITAEFVGTGGWIDSGNSTVHDVTVGTSTGVGSSPNPSSYGSSVTFTATVTPSTGGAGTPTGSVTFKEGASTLATVPLDGSGQAALITSTLTVGTHTITAEFVGTGGYLDSQGTSANHDVTAATSTSVSSSPNPSEPGQQVTFTATVNSTTPGAGTPTGTVTFKEGTTVLASVAVNGSGQASFNISSLSLGDDVITAEFVGTGGYLDSQANAPNHTVSDLTAPSVPTGLLATPGPNKKQVTLSWSASSDASGIARYEVWTSNKVNGNFKLAGTTTSTSFVHTLARSGTKAWYFVIAVDNAGNKSVASAKVQGTALRGRAPDSDDSADGVPAEDE